MLKRKFNDRIASIVLAVSNERGWDKKEILFKTLPKIWKDYLAIFVKLCDRIANTTNSKNGYDKLSSVLYKRYKHEYPVFRYALKNNDQYFEMWEELDRLNR
jgi:(p)ppGpp synthase/HD superfamily hydrolase